MKNKNKGFTLIELLAVIVILAIIMVIATMQVNKQIKKSKKNANEINKETITKAAKACMVEKESEKCDTIEELQEGGYLDSFSDPWDKDNDNLDEVYTIIINDEETDAKIIYSGTGVTEENETPPNEYFSWCNSDKGKHTCTDGLTNEGKAWLQKHDDILIFPSTITTIKDCESGKSDCTNFSGVNIDALIATSIVSISADFSDAEISVVRVDGGSITNSKFTNAKIEKLVLGKTTDFSLYKAFPNATINYFKLEKGRVGWDAFSATINTIEVGDGVYYMTGNAIYPPSPINRLVFNSPCIFKGRRNPYDGNYNGSGWGKGVDKTDCSTSLEEQSKYSFDWFDPPFRLTTNELIIGDNVTIIPSHLFWRTKTKKIIIGKNVKIIEENAFNSSIIEEIVIKGDVNRFDDVWDKIPFPSKDKVKIIQG